MKITTIQISGFRKILKATINMEDDITVIAAYILGGETVVHLTGRGLGLEGRPQGQCGCWSPGGLCHRGRWRPRRSW